MGSFIPLAPEAMSALPTTQPRPAGPPGPAVEDAWIAGPPPPAKSRRRRLTRILILSTLLPLLSVAGALVALYLTTALPEIPAPAETTVLLDRDGNEVAKLHAGVDRQLIDRKSVV